jgi:hypothetical protein
MNITDLLQPEDLYMEFRVKKKSGRSWIITPDGSDPVFEKVAVDKTIFKALVKAHLWKRYLRKGQFVSMKELSERKSIAESYIKRIIRLNYLSPKIKVMIIEGTQPKHLKLQDLMEDIPTLWRDQEEKFLK